MKQVLILFLGLSSLLPLSAQAQEASLTTLMDRCWAAVDGDGLEALAPYNMTFQGIEQPRKNIENHVWSGLARTNLGEIGVTATLRNNILFDCTLMQPLDQPQDNTIQFADAAEAMVQWYSEKLALPGHFEVFSDDPFLGVVRCARDQWTITSSVTSMDPVDPTVIPVDRPDMVPGAIRLVVFLTNPVNFDECQGSGAL